MENNKQQFPTEEVTLPSKGLLYPQDSPLSKGIIEMKYMTAREEDILTNQNLIENGTVIDKLLQSLIVTDFNYNDLLVGDKNAILVAARILGYGKDFEFTQNGENISVDLTTCEDKELDPKLVIDNKNEFYYELPTSKKSVTFKFLTHEDEKKMAAEIKGLTKLNKNVSKEMTTRMKHVITSVDGDFDKTTVRKFVDNELLAIDARELRRYIEDVQPNIDLSFDHEDSMGNTRNITIPVNLHFFWPDVEL